MKLAHLADPHLGFRQFQRQTPQGINQREADVGAAFRQAIDAVIAARPDVVVIAGDLFHAVRPTNAAIVFTFRQLQRLTVELPDAPIILIAGNHDTPRSADTGSILKLYEELGVHVATSDAQRFVFPALGLSVLAVPHAALVGERPALRPEGSEPHQVLVLHGEADGVFPADRSTVEYGGAIVTTDDVRPDLWSYVAWGHYHVQREVAPRAWYAGALEYVSTNIWGERAEEAKAGRSGKGWLLVDLDTGAVTPQPLTPARRILDLPPVGGRDLEAAALDALIAQRIAEVPGGIAHQIVRLVVHDVPRHVARSLDHTRLRAWKNEALHFQLDVRRPDAEAKQVSGVPRRRQTLPGTVRDYLGRRPLPSELDREHFVATGVQLVEEVERDALDG